MEQLNQYLEMLVSRAGYELHLKPNRNPYLVDAAGESDVATSPLLGTQISMMVFPLIPPDVKQDLPNQPQVQFIHPHNLGKFNFTVEKSPAGFNVTVRPILGDALKSEADQPELDERSQDTMSYSDDPPATVESSVVTNTAVPSEPLPHLVFNQPEPAPELNLYNGPELQVISVDDPQCQTVFSDSSTYEPPGRRQDFEQLVIDSFSPQVELPATELPDALETPAPRSYTFSDNAPAEEEQSFEQQMPLPEFTTVPSDVQLPSMDRRKSDRRKKNLMMTARMDALFNRMAELGASDLHLSVSMPPVIRKDGKMQALECDEQVLTPELVDELVHSIMPDKNREEFEHRNDTDFAYELIGVGRFRCNAFRDRKGMGGVFRLIPAKMTTAEQLGLSPAILELCKLSKGLVVVTGPTGSGKSTTLCAMVNHINMNRDDHVITIEDPIEFVHENIKCLVNQREVNSHTGGFKDALRAALREDPDIVLVGEMRDLETIAIAIETAETGHLVFGTLHTTNAASTVDRIIDQFPTDRQQQIRVMLSESLKGVISQVLLPKKGGGRVAALEVLIVTPAISNLIREGKTFQIPSAIQTGKSHGMVMLNDALFDLVQKGLVEPRDAYFKASDKAGFETMLTRAGMKL